MRREVARKRGAKKRGPKVRDFADRVRAVVWLACVLGNVDEPIDQLEKRLIKAPRGREGLTHTLKDIQKLGTDPNWKKTSRRKKASGSRKPQRPYSLVEKAADLLNLQQSANLYNSKLWQLLSKPEPKIETVQSILRDQLLKLNLYRIEGPVYAEMMGTPNATVDPSFAEFNTPGYAKGITDLQESGGLDQLLLLAALYLEADYYGDRLRQHYLTNSVTSGAVNYCVAANINGLPRHLFLGLIERRLLQGRYAALFHFRDLRYARDYLGTNHQKPARKGKRRHPNPKRAYPRFIVEAHALLLGKPQFFSHGFAIVKKTELPAAHVQSLVRRGGPADDSLFRKPKYDDTQNELLNEGFRNAASELRHYFFD